MAESLFQPSIRLYIYDTIASIIKSDGDLMKNQTFNTKTIPIKIPYHYAYTNFHNQISSKGELMKFEAYTQRQAINYIIAYRILINLPAAILTLSMGGWSDRYGRKLTLLLPCIGGVVSCGMMGLSYVNKIYGTMMAITVILVAVLMYGITGKSALVTMGSNSYVIDCTSDTERTIGLGRLLGMNFFGIFIGSLLIGVLSQFSEFYSTLSIVAIIDGMLALCIAFLLPESSRFSSGEIKSKVLPDEATPITSDMNENNVEPTKTHSIWGFLTMKRDGNNRLMLHLLLLMIFTNQFTKAGEQDVILLYVLNSKVGWTNQLYGYYLAIYYGFMGLNLVFLLPFLEKFIRPKDTIIAMIGVIMKLIRLIITGSTNMTWLIFVAAIFGSTSGFIMASTKSMLSKICNEDEMGIAFSMIAALEAISSLLGPIVFNLIYSATINLYIGSVFYIDACLYFCMIIGYLKFHWDLYR